MDVNNTKKLKLWQIGLIIIVVGMFVNIVFMKIGIGGLLRELSRLSFFVGLAVLLIGLVRNKKSAPPVPPLK